METVNLAKAIIKFNNQYFVIQSDSVVKKWKFFDAVIEAGQSDLAALSKGLKSQFEISQNIGKLFCEISCFEMGKQYVAKTYFVNIFDQEIAEKMQKNGKFLLISELKTLKFENLDKVIFQKILDLSK